MGAHIAVIHSAVYRSYTYHGIVNYTGVIQKTLESILDITVNQAYFDIMNIPGAIFIYTLFLYPYVYTITRIFLSQQSASLIESARMLGRGPWQIFYKVSSHIKGFHNWRCKFSCTEVLNDYGVVKYYGIQTFSTAIFQTWFGLGDIESSIKLAASFMGLVIFILVIEKLLRGRKQYSYSTTKIQTITFIRLKGAKARVRNGIWHGYIKLGFSDSSDSIIDWLILTWGKFRQKTF